MGSPDIETPEVEALADDELVDDRALVGLDADQFGHGDFVRELAGVICKVNTPANIALFGPWGAGKSGIANLLARELTRPKRELRFVVFDASKYAEAPLRRHFISRVAAGLNLDDGRFHEELYRNIEDRTIKFRPGEWGKLAFTFLVSIALTFAALLAIATIVAALSKGPFSDAWSKTVKDYLLATVPVAAAIGTFVKLAADGFHVKSTRSAPSGEEEFEQRFQDLVAASGTERLVVFIDELDRCSPVQVAAVLETLKTFLFIERCVFIVAADQQVLEQALRQAVSQHTPDDSLNPYYSAGSSYLDKVFQYQLALPPLKSPTLSRFALDLVKDRPGVWQRVPALEEAVSVLIPTHVVSPRRVKVLLNRFAIAFRLAERRAARGMLDPNFGTRATELAKLVCLQCEFPLFAADLKLDGRLPEYVRRVADGQDLPWKLRSDVVDRAREYALGQRAVAELLVADEGPAGTEEHEATADLEQAGGEPTPDVQPISEVARSHSEQLVRYLRKTQEVPGPSSDLLYLESAGAPHGIDVGVADQLERAALDNDTRQILRLIESTSGEGQAVGALRVLADVVRTDPIGQEGRNVVSSLLRSIEQSGVALEEADADYLADAVAGHLAAQGLEDADLVGALSLAKSCTRSLHVQLVEAVVRHPGSTDRPEVAVLLLARTGDVRDAKDRKLVGRATATAILEAPGETADQLVRLSATDRETALTNALPDLKQRSAAHYKAVAAKKQGSGDVEGELETPPSAVLHELLGALPTEARDLRLSVVRLMLELDHMDYRSAVARELPNLAPIDDVPTTAALLRAAHRRRVDDLPRWLDSLDPATVASDQAAQEWLDSLVAEFWDKAHVDDPPPTAEAMSAALASIARLTSATTIHNDATGKVVSALTSPLTTTAAIEQRSEDRALAQRLVDAGAVSAEKFADADLAVATETLSSTTIPATAAAEADTAAIEIATTAMPAASDGALDSFRDGLGDAARLMSWQRDALAIGAAAAAARYRPVEDLRPTADQVRTLGEQVSVGEELAVHMLARWLRHLADDPLAVWPAFQPFAGSPLPKALVDELARFANDLTPAERLQLLAAPIERAILGEVDRSFLAAAHLSEAPAARVADLLITGFQGADDTATRERVLDLWQVLSPSGDATRRRLIEAIYLPLASSGDEGLDLALSYFGLVASAKGVRRAVRDALRAAARTKKQKSRVDAVLNRAGWTRKGLFGLGPTIDRDT